MSMGDLGGLTMGAGGPAVVISNVSNMTSMTLSQPPRQLLRHEMGGGLQVEYQFGRGSNSGSQSTIVLTVKNMRDSTIRRIRVNSLRTQLALTSR